MRNEQELLRTELRWAAFVLLGITILLVVIIGTGLAFSIHPPSHHEYIDPKTLHLSEEFAEANLGTRVAADGSVTTRIVATQFAFLPQCIAVPQNQRVTFRFATPDVIHGILIANTNVNTMIMPGYVSQVSATFPKAGDTIMPCHEFCGLGHSEMWAVVRVVPPADWHPDAQGRVSCAKS